MANHLICLLSVNYAGPHIHNSADSNECLLLAVSDVPTNPTKKLVRMVAAAFALSV